MKLPSFKRLFKGDFKPDDQELVDKMSYTINSGLETLYEALNKRLTFDENFNSSQHTITVTVDANGTPSQRTSVTTTLQGVVAGIIVTKAINSTSFTSGAVYPASTPFISYTQSNQQVTINNIKGLTAGIPWTLSFIVLGS